MKVWAITILLVVGLAACGTEPAPPPQQTPETNLAESITVTVEIIEPTLTATAISTGTPQSTSTLTLIPETEAFIPEITETPISPTPIPTLLPLTIENNIEVVLIAEKVNDLFWSPAQNEFVQYIGCPRDGNSTIQIVDLIQEEQTDITPVNLGCYASITWHPSEEYFLFSSITVSQDGYENSRINGWKVNRNDLIPIDLGQKTYYWGWLNDDIVIHEEHVGTGTFYISMFDFTRNESLSSTHFDGRAKDISRNFVILNEELGFSYNTSVAVLAHEPISPEYGGWQFGSDIKFFGKKLNTSGWEVSYYSRYADVLPSTDKILAVTWKEPLLSELDPGQLISGTVPANLQLIDAQTGELMMVLSGGIYGRFSPDGSIVAAMTPDDPYPNLQLFSYPDGEKLLSLPAFAETVEYSAEVFAHTTFSPNGRYFTFFTPNTDLVVYDIQTGELMPPVTAVPTEPIWSPNNTHFVYTDPAQGLSIYDTRSHTTYPLAESGGERLSNPQWSFDGIYLSVAYTTEDYEWQTAVLSLP